MGLLRALRHLSSTRWALRRRFTPEVLADIEAQVQHLESRHAGEVRFAVEAAFDLQQLWAGLGPRERALEVFAQLGVWDTEANNGVLIYVLLAEHDVEIVADRGIAARVTPQEWEQVCQEMERHFRAGRFRDGAVAGVRAVGTLLAQHFPRSGADANELPNQPVLL